MNLYYWAKSMKQLHIFSLKIFNVKFCSQKNKTKEKKRENISIYTSGEFFDVRNLQANRGVGMSAEHV